MANISLGASGYWGDDAITGGGSWAALAWGEDVDLNGYNLTVDPSVQAATNIGIGASVTNNTGLATFFINNQSASGLSYYGPDTGDLKAESSCEFKTSGNYIEIGTSDGTSGQVFTGWTTVAGFDVADDPSCIEVETGSGTGIYKQWTNICDLSLSTNCGLGDFGNLFKGEIASGTIIFGDGGRPEDLYADASGTQTYVDVSDSSEYVATDFIQLRSDVSGSKQTTTIASISVGGGEDATDRLNLDDPLDFDFNTSDNAFIRHSKGGNIPPNGAKIRVYNIVVGCRDVGGSIQISSSEGSDYTIDIGNAGIVNIDKTYFCGFNLSMTGGREVSIKNAGVIHPMLVQDMSAPYFYRVAFGVNRYNTASDFGFDFNQNVTDPTMVECITFQRYGRGVHFDISENLVCTDCFFGQLTRPSTSSTSWIFLCEGGSIDLTCTDCTFIGTSSLGVLNATFTDCYHSASPYGEPYYYTGSTTNEYYQFYRANEATFLRLKLHPDGYSSMSQVLFLATNNVDIIQMDYDFKYFSSMINFVKRIKLIDSYVGGCREAVNQEQSDNGCFMQNVRVKDRTVLNSEWFNTSPSNSIYKAHTFKDSDVDTSPGRSVDTHFYEGSTSSTDGIMGLIFNPKSSTGTGYVESAENIVKWNMSGSMYILEAGGYVIWTWPHWVKGITAFPVGGSVNENGSTPSAFTKEYQIDLGSGYNGSWLTLNHTNLSTHTIDPDVGFKMKIKITHPTGSATNLLNRLNWETTIDYETYKYPIDTVDVILENIADGSEWWLYNDDTMLVLGSGTQSGTDDITVEDVPYNGDETLLLRVRKSSASPFYKPFSTNGTLTSTGARIWVEQIVDTLIS